MKGSRVNHPKCMKRYATILSGKCQHGNHIMHDFTSFRNAITPIGITLCNECMSEDNLFQILGMFTERESSSS